MKKKILSLLLVIAMTMSMLCACGTSESTTEDAATEETTTEENEKTNQILCIGSSTLAPVVTQIATDMYETYETWNAYDSSLTEDGIEIYVSSGGSGQGVKAVIDGTTDFGMVSRNVKDEEKESIENMTEVKVGVDALTMGVNPENPILALTDDLTTDQIIKIFSGEYTTWSDVDASLPAEDIVVYVRDINGGAHEVFQKNIMGDVEVKADAIVASSMGELVQAIIDNPYAIGYASFGVVNQNAGKVTPLKVDGVEANVENILSGAYIIQRPLLLVASGELSAEEQAFVDVMLSEEGQATVEEMGFIPVK